MRSLSLPSWAKMIVKGKIEAEASEFYPEILEELGITEVGDEELEIAFQCMKMDIQHAVAGTEAMPKSGGALVIIVNDASKEESGISKWRQSGEAKPVPIGKIREQYAKIRPGLT